MSIPICTRLNPGDQVNLEFDILGKYVLRYLKKPRR